MIYYNREAGRAARSFATDQASGDEDRAEATGERPAARRRRRRMACREERRRKSAEAAECANARAARITRQNWDSANGDQKNRMMSVRPERLSYCRDRALSRGVMPAYGMAFS